MHFEYTTIRKIEFSETDMAGLVHFSNFFKYMESAERDFYEHINLKLIESSPKLLGFPRARAECKFSEPLRFGDEVKIHLAVKAVKDYSIDYQFRFFKMVENKDSSLVAKGHLTTIYAEQLSNGELKSKMLTDAIKRKIIPAPLDILKGVKA